jgi:DNA-binding LacI/PurR family transcriptional regulator
MSIASIPLLKPTDESGKGLRHITSHDVAKRAGVSQSAVSRCFTPGASVAPQTRARVLQAAAELNYRPNVHARNLITGRSSIIGVVVAHLDNLFYPRFLQLLTERLQARGLQVLLFVADGNEETELMEQLLNYRVDGIVLAATTLNARLARSCTTAGIPVVLFNRVVSPDRDSGFHSVQTDQESGAFQLTRLLIEQGHQRIAYLAGKLESSTNQTRERGCRDALAQADQTMFAYGLGEYDEAVAAQQIRNWYTLDGRRKSAGECPDAIVAADDRMAIAAMDTLRHELGINIPEQVSVVGFDDVPQASWPSYDLTTYAQPVADMIDAVLSLLSMQIQARIDPNDPVPPGQAVILPGQLKLRSSVRHSPPRSSPQPRRKS